MNFKWLMVPFSNETKDILVPKTWEVRWESRYGEYSGNIRPELEVFLSEDEAKQFAISLRNAFRLIRHKSGTSVEVKKSK